MAHQYFLAYFILTSCLVAGQDPKYALKGEEVNLRPDITGQPDQILWKHNNKNVVEFNGQEQHVYSPYENRITLDWVSAELHITDPRFEDSGEYVLEVYMNKVLNDLHRSHFVLEVIDEVAKPTISCEINGSSSHISGIQATLACSAEPRRLQSLMKFEWKSHGNVQPGPNLTIPLGGRHDDEEYSCIVSNPLSQQNATFTSKDCYRGKPSASSVALIASLVSVFAIMLLCLGIVWCKRSHKACFAEGTRDDLEKAPSGTTAGSDKKTALDVPLLNKGNKVPSPKRLEPRDGDLHEDEMPQREHVKDKIKIFEKRSLASKFQTGLGNKCLYRKNAASDNKGNAGQPREPAKKRVKANESVPAGVLGDFIEATQSNPQSSAAPEQPVSESKKEADENADAKSPPANDVSPPTAQPHSPLTTHTREEDQQEMDKCVSAVAVKSDSVGDSEEIEKEQDLYLATSQLPQSPTPTKPHNGNTNTFQESPDTAHREGEGNTGPDSSNVSLSEDTEGQKKDEVVA